MSDGNRRLLELMTALGSMSLDDRVRALRDIEDRGIAVLPILLDILDHPDASMRSRVWTMMAIERFGPMVAEQAHSALVRCLAATCPTVRRAAIRTLGKLRDFSAIGDIAALRADTTIDPSAWFDDDCTVAQTAELTISELRRASSQT
jgi:HEAT repeat protein